MKIKGKRFLILLSLVSVFVTAAYASAADLLVANKTEYRCSALGVTKTSKDNSATVNMTKGPVSGTTTVYAYVGGKGNDVSYKTQTAGFTSPMQKKLYYNPFDYNEFRGKTYYLYAMIDKYAYLSTTTVAGSFTP
ncbi:MAG: hypothetical protein E7269_07005 [Lachnospiraceae bacterium]|nr:hypothetical protein [Lachnospiraceae bacterium]